MTRKCTGESFQYEATLASSHATTAFTLVELIVVIAIIALLAALLLPALSGAKASARRVECISRMNQWNLAFLQYTEDNEGMIPREGFDMGGEVYLNNWAQVRHAQSRDVWYNALSNYVKVPPASSYAPPVAPQEFYHRNSFFHCPSAIFPKSAGIALTPFFSIAMNSQLIEPPRNVPTISFYRIQRTSQTPLFLDNLLDGEKRVSEAQPSVNLGQPAAMANRFAGVRHGRTGNISFADGHTDSIPGTKVVETHGPNAGNAILPPKDIFWELE
jgi:prepilin-type processing-associated H-X9-DG protein/prepilin-type N-terminal cleavage/methylation domain-containing protein